MRLLGFNAGRIRPQLIDGEVVRTGYVKSPVPEPWRVTDAGAEGDEVAAHTDHLYAFDRASYDHWAAELGADRAAWGDGHFAENLTVDVLDASLLRVGDRFALGEAELVVTGPRVPCWKLTWRLGQPKTFMRRFRLSGRSGVYLGVLRPGRARPGDEFVPLGGEDDRPTVVELSRLCDSGTRITPDERAVIDRALASPHLSATVRATLDLKVAGIERESGAYAGGWKGWRPFDVDEVVDETAEIVSVSLRPRDRGALPAPRAGQHVVVRLAEAGREPVVRTWSLSSFSARPERYRISVRVRPDGRGSRLLARAGSGAVSVELRAPAGRFHLDRGTFRPVVLVAAGIGITPMVAMIQAHLERGPGMPPLWLLYGVRTPEEAAFRHELERVFAGHDDLHLHWFLTRPAGEPPVGEVHEGRITAERVVEVMRDNYIPTPGGRVDVPWFESDAYVCGSPEFAEAVREGLISAGANPDLVFAEDFAAAASAPLAPLRRTDALVRFGQGGPDTAWEAATEKTLLEVAEDSGLEPPTTAALVPAARASRGCCSARSTGRSRPWPTASAASCRA
ncbi:MOSC domain-containing protein [Microbacterium marinilacus]|uniref:MOSC and FAD-binding oxidoreductase domain-containing protein n=1 Tax=Microbacterium marinilacus TaxID=415209 RepID=A0ABP7BNX3_9MICO|nr:MOSC domain-containing protein [Microbacterium marinilacus]MBY0690283.1 MOSC domain-containing protein [Microbacterium marinilacus]